MKFLSNFFSIEIPHRKFAFDAHIICTSILTTPEERILLAEIRCSEDHLTKRRIALRVDIVNFLLSKYDKLYPKSDSGAAQSVFFLNIQEKYKKLPESIRSDDYPGSIHPSIESVVLKFLTSINVDPTTQSSSAKRLYHSEITLITKHFEDNAKKIGLTNKR